jgi:hypothetical protein
MKTSHALAAFMLAVAAHAGAPTQTEVLDAAFDRCDVPAVERKAQRPLAANVTAPARCRRPGAARHAA